MECRNVIILNLLVLLCFETSRGQEEHEIFEVSALPGGTAQLPCNMKPEVYANKLNVLTWFNDKSSKAIYSRDYRHETPPATSRLDTRYRFAQLDNDTGALVIHPVDKEDAGGYRCHADFVSSRSRDTYVHLKIIEEPSHMVVLNGNGTKVTGTVGPYREGEELILICVVFGGEPVPNVTWWRGSELLDDTWTRFSVRRVRNELNFGKLHRKHYGMTVTCSASNHDIGDPLAMDVTVDMNLKPTEVVLYASEEPLRPGPFQLQCQIFGARPTPTFVWLKDAQQMDLEQNLVIDPSGRGDLSTVTMMTEAADDGRNVTCCTERHTRELELMCSKPLTLHVYYFPRVHLTLNNDIVNETAVVLGAALTLACNITANPWIFNFIWYFNDEVIKTSGDAGDDSLCPVLTLSNVTEEQSGLYRCSATNVEGIGVSQSLRLDVHYPPRCISPGPTQYGLGSDESINITCHVSANPAPATYRWLFLNTTLAPSLNRTLPERCQLLDVTERDTLEYTPTDEFHYGTILCWGINGVGNDSSVLTDEACVFTISDLSIPHQPAACKATRDARGDITVTCEKGHDGGLQQKFTLAIVSQESSKEILSVSALEPHLIAAEPTDDTYAIVIVAHNEKGSTEPVVLTKADVMEEILEEGPRGAVTNITTLVLSLGGGVGILVLVACSLVMGARERRSDAGSDGAPRGKARRRRQSAPCAYATDESNCDTCQESEGGSDSSFRRTESFHRAVSSRYQPKSGPSNIPRASSFRSPRCMAESSAYQNLLKHSKGCRMHSLQNICSTLNKRKDCEALCDHLLLHLPVDLPNYSIPKPPVPFYTMPRKHSKPMKSQVMDNLESLPLPPPPDEFHTFRSASDILSAECPPATGAASPSANYMNVASAGSAGEKGKDISNVIISPMNTVGLPTIAAENSKAGPSYINRF